jgi:hypothetical protein
MIEIIKEPQGEVYIKLIQYLTQICIEFSFCVDSRYELSNRAKKVLDLLEPHSSVNENNWSTSEEYRFSCNDKTYSILINAAEELFDWQQPWLPGYLCFYKQNGKLFFEIDAAEEIGIFHENDPYIIQILGFDGYRYEQ